jgi:hypothetical protein
MVSWYKYDFVLGAAVSSKRETLRELNPVDNELRIKDQFIDSKTRIFVQYDMLGRKLLESELSPLQKEIKIQTSQLQVGVYSYQVVYEESQSLSGKITIAR